VSRGGARKGAGRKPGAVKRSPVQVMLSDEERKHCDDAAAECGVDRSTWMRWRCVGEETRPKFTQK